MNSTNGYLNDSARARGVTHWGQNMAALSFNTQEWTSITSPGLGYLHTPIRLLDETQANALNLKLAPVPTAYRQNITTDASQPLINAGLTPLEGTLYTAHDYFRGRQQHFGAQQGRGNAETRLPESCEVNAAIWLTDGMPSVDRQGNALGNNPDRALNDAVAAAERLHRDAGVDLYVVGFAMPPTVDSDSLDRLARAGGTPHAFMATDSAGLNEAIRGIFGRVIQEGRQTATAAAVNSGRLTSDTLAFLSGYRPSDSSGELIAQNLQTGQRVWDAEQRLRSSSAPLLVQDAEQNRLVDLRSATVPTALFEALNRNPLSDRIDGLANARIQWLLGTEDTQLRSRTVDGQLRLLGGIVHTTPVYSGGVHYRGQDSLPGAEGRRFWNYARQAENKRPLLIAGANDGKIYGFRADNGHHQFSMIPSAFLQAEAEQAAPINHLMDPQYQPRFLMNGGLTLGDAYINDQWQRILLASLGQGGRSVVALNVSRLEQSSTRATARLWEFEHPELGLAVKEAHSVRLANGRWVAVFGNGVNSASQQAGLFVVDLATGELLRFLSTASGREQDPNGILAITPSTQAEGSLVVDRIYAGDLYGQVWRFDLSATSPEDWQAERLLTATTATGGRQPITAAPEVTRDRRLPGQRIILVGTGSFFRTGDRADQTTQSFYGLYDDGQRTNGQRSQLLQQQILWEQSLSHAGQQYILRGTSQNTPTAQHRGWVLDLTQTAGERVVSQAHISAGGTGQRVRFNSLIVNEPADICQAPSRSGFLFELDLLSGAALSDSRFVVTDGTNLADLLESGRLASAISHNQGQGAATVLETGADSEVLVTGDGQLITVTSDPQSTGRRSWEQLR
ncbi:pilus assembly protein [Marinospirillum sp.]|uniref:pilus assembly protein n=1 Tax=Marinospirillum sp. TaxID=2183934 RepID=UPI003A83F444